MHSSTVASDFFSSQWNTESFITLECFSNTEFRSENVQVFITTGMRSLESFHIYYEQGFRSALETECCLNNDKELIAVEFPAIVFEMNVTYN